MPGQGSIQFNQSRTPGGGGGGVTGADNGLTVVAGVVELGGANPLLHNTSLLLGVSDFTIERQAALPVRRYLTFEQAADIFQFGNIDNGNFLSITGSSDVSVINSVLAATGLIIDFSTDSFLFGDINNIASGIEIFVDGTSDIAAIDKFGDNFLELDFGFGTYGLGDLNAVNNFTFLSIDDGNNRASISSGGFEMLSLDMGTGFYTLGSGSFFQINDSNQTFITYAGGVANGINIDANNLNYSFGDTSNSFNGTSIVINDTAGLFYVSNNTMADGLSIDNLTRAYAIGDVGVNFNFTRINVDDNATTITMTAANGVTLFADLHVTGVLYVPGATDPVIFATAALSNNAGAAVGTLTNAPTVGNPTKWIKIDDAGTTRFIPTWT